MKRVLVFVAGLFPLVMVRAQSYPQPEFVNEIYYFQKDSGAVKRLEKGSSKMDTKIKMAGLGGAESGYEMEGERSTVRLTSGKGLSFIYYTGSSSSSSAKQDSMLRANGVDPAMMNAMMEPSGSINLYKADAAKNKRKVYLQKSGGALSFGNKNQSSDKYTFSVKKVKDGYWELAIDKTLPKGEYIFTTMNMGFGSMDGSMTLFAFAVD